MRKTILIFSASIGSGHDAAAAALREQFITVSPHNRVTVIDSFEFVHPVLHKIVSGSYFRTLRNSPKVWGYLYDHTDKGSDQVTAQAGAVFFFSKYEELLKKMRPDIVITTHPFPTAILSVLRGRGTLQVPLNVVLTDFSIHSLWLHAHVDRYFLSSQEAVNECMHRGVDKERIFHTGIPIRHAFNAEQDRDVIIQRYNLDQRPVLLLCGGGDGLGDVYSAVKELLTWGDFFQLMVVTGKNETLYRKLRPLALVHDNCRLFGYVDNMAELMTVADLLIGKSGGLTAAEAAAMELPMVVIDPIPGQEEKNAEFLVQMGAAIIVERQEDLPLYVYNLLEKSGRLDRMREAVGNLGHKDASEQVYRVLVSDYCI